MTLETRLRQVRTIAQMELRRTFLSKRSFWVYALALFPCVIFFGHGIETKFRAQKWTSEGVTPAAKVQLITLGDTLDEVRAKAGTPIRDNSYIERRRVQRNEVPEGAEVREVTRRRSVNQRARRNGQMAAIPPAPPRPGEQQKAAPADPATPATPAESDDERREREQREREENEVEIAIKRNYFMYWDGVNRTDLNFSNGILTSKETRPLVNFKEDRVVFASVFHYFYLRLAIFFGCLGIFMNLFRGEMLDKTLHFWLLLPVRREVLLGGKYLAGLIAATVIFTVGTTLCFSLMLWPQDPVLISTYWSTVGPSHLARYAAAAALACAGYGSVFLAAGMLMRNPLVPAVLLSLWESLSGFLPQVLQKLSVLHYVRSICPVPPPTEQGMPALMRLLLNPAEPTSIWIAVPGLLALTALVLWAASKSVKRLEINYGGD